MLEVKKTTVYYSIDEAINKPEIHKKYADRAIVGLDRACNFIAENVLEQLERKQRSCIIAFDGFLGVQWDDIVSEVCRLLNEKGVEVTSIDFSSFYSSYIEIENMIRPCLSRDPYFGFVFSGELKDFLDFSKLEGLKNKFRETRRNHSFSAVICYGCGVAISLLRGGYDQIFYFDLTREEVFNRSEKKSIYFLGSGRQGHPIHNYLKRFYYVDSIVLDKHKKEIIKHIDWYVDSNNTKDLKLLPRDVYKKILFVLAQYPFVVKPLYYPVAWGGNWLKKVKNLPKEMENSGQGFLVANENSIRISVKGHIIEIPFSNFLWEEPVRILGNYAFKKFDGKFPLAYWYDDSIGGGHMAIQVHADYSYMKKHFNEKTRQDESYYILYTESNAKTYLGFRENVDLDEFYKVALRAEKEGIAFDQDKFVNSIPTKPGDYFLIPNGMIHASGRNQVVLEIDGVISSYASGYTFHIFDYLRSDLNGSLRPIHLKHSFSVLKDRRANWVSKNLNQKPRLIRANNKGAEYLIGRRNDMYYETHLIEFSTEIEDNTGDLFHALTLVQGDTIVIQSKKHPKRKCKLGFPDTIIVPACFGEYTLVNMKNEPCRVVKALIKIL
jgi:mannose-6-phosphate isomerase class I